MLNLVYIKWKNFLSTGNDFSEIKLNSHKNTLLVGKNGSGKSTFIDALSFALFGKPFRNINKPTLLNSINQKDCIAEVGFKVGNKEYKVIRGIKPTIFEIYCNGVLLNQDSKSKDYQDYLEKFILKTNFKSFKQIIVLGSSSFVPFMQLVAADRRSIIEELLDIQIFSYMNIILKQKLSDVKDRISELKNNGNVVEIKINGVNKLIEEINNNKDIKIAKLQKETKESKKQYEDINRLNETVLEEITLLDKKIEDRDKVNNKLGKLSEYESIITSNIKKLSKELQFYTDNNNCHTCHQDIDSLFRDNKIVEHNKKINDFGKAIFKIKDEYANMEKRLNEIKAVLDEIKEKNMLLVKNSTTIHEIQKYIDKVQNEIVESNKSHGSLSDEKNNLKDLTEEQKNIAKEEEEKITRKHYLELASGLLKDTGIKTKIIKQYIPIMNKLINKYLTELDFFVNFTINENFEESIKSRHRDEFSYENFSEGEKTRIDLALLFTWRAIAKMKNSVSSNIIIFDEILDSSLDHGGIDDFMNIIQNQEPGTNIFVISNRSEHMIEKFDNVLFFEKKNNFSIMKEGV